MVKINQHVFDLANGRVTLVDLAANELARLALPANVASSMPAIGVIACPLVDTSLCVC
jgi:hypothetical protein